MLLQHLPPCCPPPEEKRWSGPCSCPLRLCNAGLLAGVWIAAGVMQGGSLFQHEEGHTEEVHMQAHQCFRRKQPVLQVRRSGKIHF
jgi:hypothetical protein